MKVWENWQQKRAAALSDEELAFFDARDSVLVSFGEQVEEADTQIQQALCWLVEGLQKRWGAMVRRQELTQRFASISQSHNTPESFSRGIDRLAKTFWEVERGYLAVFVASFLGRVSAILPNMETTTPADAVRTIYERPVVVDIGKE